MEKTTRTSRTRSTRTVTRSCIIDDIKLKRTLAPRSESRTLSAMCGEASSPEVLKMNADRSKTECELELIQTEMTQKPMLRAEVYAHAMRASQNRKKEVRREKEV